MTRDELEAEIWRRWATRDQDATEAIDAILTAADSYARTVAVDRADAASRRAVLAAGPKVPTVHLRCNPASGTSCVPACGNHGNSQQVPVVQLALTSEPAQVTCGLCKRTSWYRGVAA